MNIETFIQTNRNKKHLTQAELAKLLHVSNTTISNYENGVSTPNMQTLLQMADIFETSLEELSFGKISLFASLIKRFYGIINNFPLDEFKFVQISSRFARCPYITEGDIVFVRKIRKKPAAGTLLLVDSEDGKNTIYKLSYSNCYYILSPCTTDKSQNPITLKNLSANMREIKSVIHFL